MIYLDGFGYDDMPMALRDVSPLGELLSDVAGPKPAFFTPVRVPIRPMRAARTALFAAADGLEPVGDLRVLRWTILLETGSVAMKQKPPDEDHQAPEVVLVQASDGPDQLSIDRHDGLS
jgi:hypothetical protein